MNGAVIRALACASVISLAAVPGFPQAGGTGGSLPPSESASLAALEHSPRHAEWLTIDAGSGDKVRTWIVYPQRPDPAPVVLVVHEIFGLSDWVRAVADQLAAEGFIAAAPDLLSGKAPGGKGSEALSADQVRQLIADLQMPEIMRRLDAAARFVTGLPSASGTLGTVGFCWGGGISFAYAAAQPALRAAVVCYGTPPDADAAARIKAPVLGLYGGADARVTSTVAPTASMMEKLGKRYEHEVYDGAGHAFFRQQDGMQGANLAATQKGWPRMVDFLKQHLATAAASLDPGFARLASLHAGDAVAATAPTCTCDGD